MEADSMEAILALLKDHPHFITPRRNSIEVYEAMPMV
jgi:hypothetical protein